MNLESNAQQSTRLRRRSQRLKIVVPVEIITHRENAPAVREQAQAVSLNAHGAMLLLKSAVEEGQLMRIMNGRSREEEEVRVVSVSAVDGGKWAVGIEFTRPARGFWQISFPSGSARASAGERS